MTNDTQITNMALRYFARHFAGSAALRTRAQALADTRFRQDVLYIVEITEQDTTTYSMLVTAAGVLDACRKCGRQLVADESLLIDDRVLARVYRQIADATGVFGQNHVNTYWVTRSKTGIRVTRRRD